MANIGVGQNFDELFLKAEKDPPTFYHINIPPGSSGPSTRLCSQNNSRGSPARKPTQTGLCPGNPALLDLKQRNAASRSLSMRDQTAHMREKYQSDPSKLNQRRLSTKTPIPIITKSGSRNNSLPSEEVEVTRQFLATNSKVVNRGDSFKRKTQYTRKKRDTAEDTAREIPRVEPTSLPEHVYRVAFLGCSQVGKSSIIEQFMSSDHADVYERSGGLEPQDSDMDIRRVSVDVNGEESRLDLIEAAVEDLTVKEVVEDQNPDCFVIVYAVDDKDSLKYADSCLDWLSKYGSLLEKPCILVGNKSDLARSRVIEPTEGCDLAVKYQVKFTESSPGCGHMVDELLVGIVLQLRLHENKEPKTHHRSIKETVRGLLSLVTGKEEERRKQCRNLNV